MTAGTRRPSQGVRIGIPARLLPRGIRGILVVLLLVLVAPGMVVEAGHYYNVFTQRRAQELQANLEVARGVAATFDAYVDDILHQELAVGTALVVAQPLSLGQMTQILAAAASENPSIRMYRWVDPRGQILASSQADGPSMSFSDSDYFQEIVAGREWVVGDLSQGRTSGLVTFVIARAIRDERGEWRGVVSAMIDPRRLGEVLRIERAGQGSIMVVDRQGRVVHRYPGEQLPWDQQTIAESARFVDSALDGVEVAATYTLPADGQRRMAGFASITSIGWAAVASRPEAEVVTPIVSELLRGSAQNLFVAVVALIAARFVGRALTRPIRRLREHALALGRGDLSRRVEVDAPAELADLAMAFNQMADAIEARTREREIVLDIVRDVADTDDLDSSLHYLASQLARAVDVPICRVALLANDGRDLVVRASYAAARPGPAPALGRTFPVDDVPPARQVIEGKQPVEIDSLESDLLSDAERQRWQRAGLQTALGVPLMARDRVIGLLTLGDLKPRRFAPAEKRLIVALAQQAAVVIEKAALHQQVALDMVRMKEAEQLKDEFVSLLSHDLRQPLSVIHGYGSILQRYLAQDRGSVDAERYARNIVESAAVVNAMVADLTDSARLESGRLVLHRRPTALPDLVAEVLRTRVPSGDRPRVRAEAASGLAPVLADTDRLGRVLANLLSNALKYSPSDREVLVRTASMDGEAVLSVTDYGVGVPADEIPHLFERFYRARTGRQYEGAGLGLYIARGLVEAHGGRIWVESEPENGSTFSIALPLVTS